MNKAIVFLSAVFLLLLLKPGTAAELLIIEQPGCHWCAHWNEEVGNAYPLTEEGKIAPLRRIDISDGWPTDLAHIQRERMTPSFILMEDGKEVGRLRGYPGDHFFWPLLQNLLSKLDNQAQPQ